MKKLSIHAIVLTLFVGCGAPAPQFKAYVPPTSNTNTSTVVYKDKLVYKDKVVFKDKVIYKEKVVYRNTGVNSIEETRKSFANSGNHFNFKSSTKMNDNAFALIIGINDYKDNTNVEFADYSALSFEKLAKTTLGVPEENIVTLINSDASSGQLKAKIQFIKEIVDEGGTIYLFYAGHGVPGKDGKVYMLPSDMSADSIHLEPNLQLDKIYSNLSKSDASEIFVFMDSCFSGKDAKGDLLYKGVAPVLRVNKAKIRSKKLTVMTAGSSNDFANEYKDKEQRLFSYHLIKELANGNSNLNNVYKSIRKKVKRSSLRKGIGYKQVPQIYGNLSKKLY